MAGQGAEPGLAAVERLVTDDETSPLHDLFDRLDLSLRRLELPVPNRHRRREEAVADEIFTEVVESSVRITRLARGRTVHESRLLVCGLLLEQGREGLP